MSQPNSEFFFTRVLDTATLRDEWYPAFERIFLDPDDRLPLETLQHHVIDCDKNAFHALYNPQGALVGIELIHVDPTIEGALYVPYAGLTESMRNKGLYPLMAQISDQQMREFGALYSLYDFEDPARVPDYTSVPGEAAAIAEKRVNFWRRAVNCFVVDDPEIPYVRPASSDESQIQAYDLLSIRALNDDWGPVKDCLKRKGLKSPLFDHDDPAKATAMSKEAYRLLYLEMSRLQFGNVSEAELRAEFPAIEQFFTTIDRSPKHWVSLVAKDIVAKNLTSKPDMNAEITVQPSDKAAVLPRDHPVRSYMPLPQSTM